MEVLIQKRNSETPQEYPVKAPPPEKPQVGQFPTKAPPPMPAASAAGAPSEMTQGLTHANYPIPTTAYNPPPTRTSSALTHQDQLTAAQMAQIPQCSYTGQTITHPGVMNHQAHLIAVSNAAFSKADSAQQQNVHSSTAGVAQDGRRPSLPPSPPRVAPYLAGAGTCLGAREQETQHQSNRTYKNY